MKPQPPHTPKPQLDPALCVHCPNLCLFTCPATLGGGSTTTSPYGKVTAFHWLKTTNLLQPNDVAHLPFLCTECNLCTEICAHDQPVASFLYEKRAELFRQHQTPSACQSMLPDEEALRDVLITAAQTLNQNEQPSIVFAPGCATLAQGAERVVEIVQLLNQLGVSNVGVDPNAPVCCGAPWRALGDTAGFLGRTSHWRRLYHQREGVLVGDPQCLRAVTENIPSPLDKQYEPRVMSLRRFLSRTIRGVLRKPLGLSVAIHETCHTARHLGRDEAPLALLNAILQNPPISLGFHGAETQCCGGGGGMAHVAPELSLAASRSLLERAALLNVDCVLSLSPSCARTLAKARDTQKDLPRPVELIDLVAMAIDFKPEKAR